MCADYWCFGDLVDAEAFWNAIQHLVEAYTSDVLWGLALVKHIL